MIFDFDRLQKYHQNVCARLTAGKVVVRVEQNELEGGVMVKSVYLHIQLKTNEQNEPEMVDPYIDGYKHVIAELGSIRKKYSGTEKIRRTQSKFAR